MFAGVVFSFAAKRLQLYKNKVKKKSS
jgi:hypothetical protein